jgi:hypothetical protein
LGELWTWTALAAPGAKSITFCIRSICVLALRPDNVFRYFVTGPGGVVELASVLAAPPPHAATSATDTSNPTRLFIRHHLTG